MTMSQYDFLFFVSTVIIQISYSFQSVKSMATQARPKRGRHAPWGEDTIQLVVMTVLVDHHSEKGREWMGIPRATLQDFIRRIQIDCGISKLNEYRLCYHTDGKTGE